MYSVTAAGFHAGAGNILRFLRLGDRGSSAEWSKKQHNSEAEYREQLGAVPEWLGSMYRLFDCYLTTALTFAPGTRVLDVGCGIDPEFPRYAASVARLCQSGRAVYVGLDPIDRNVEDRRYPFILGRLEDLPGTIADQFDVFVFSTSLDHIEDIRSAAAAVRALAVPGALCVFWIGLHDLRHAAEASGAELFARMFTRSSPGALTKSTIAAAARVPILGMRLAKRERRLQRGEALDALHFHYFTAANVRRHLDEFGTTRDVTHVPGTNSLFATVNVGES